MQKPTVIIVAGGKNSRFSPLNTKTHKGFLPLLGKPLVVKALESLKHSGFKKVVIVVSNKDFGDNGFSKYLKNNNLELKLGLNIKLILQKNHKGMGDALLTAKDEILKNSNKSFILASPYYSDLGQKAQMLWTKKQKSNANGILLGSHTDQPEIYGVIDIDPNNPEKVVGIIEKPKKETSVEKSSPHKIKVDSVYLFDNKFLSELSSTKEEEYSLESAISAYAKREQVIWIKNTQKAESLKYPWHLFRLFQQSIEKEKTSISKNAQIAKTAVIDKTYGPVIIDSGARVGDFAKISGPCYIGKDVLVGDYAFVRGSSLEAGSIVGANSEVVRSILFEKASIHYGYLGDSILGSETQVGAGIITANKRFDRKNIRVRIKNKTVDTELKALGIITGHNVQIGIRANTMPGILLGENSTIYPGLTVDKNITENEIIKK
jgi:UDP-N-acetylglucosamine diphosphorylase / glucose-1-phosphate thymidylyltransferase / UDP-N-acetylgalactosamine diphosphorylase / glucosamine-1-phosphate N-acetyltransferase / galactosamine-1-phosphate N-acetyltransferase